jgi:hypothetical protein
MDDSGPFPLPPRLAGLARDLPPGLLRFAPVAGRGRRDGWSAARQRAFIVRLALCGSVNAAAQAVGMTRRSAYKLLERPGAEHFAAAWDLALDCGRRGRRDHAIEQALLGEVRPVFYRGRKCGERVRFSTGLTIAVLNAMAAKEQAAAATEKKGFSSNDSGKFGNFRNAPKGAMVSRGRFRCR